MAVSAKFTHANETDLKGVFTAGNNNVSLLIYTQFKYSESPTATPQSRGK